MRNCIASLYFSCIADQANEEMITVEKDVLCRSIVYLSRVLYVTTKNLSLVIERELSILNLSQHVRTCSSAKVIALYLCEYLTWSHNNRILFHKKMSCSSSPQRSRIHSYSSVTTYDCFIVFS